MTSRLFFVHSDISHIFPSICLEGYFVDKVGLQRPQSLELSLTYMNDLGFFQVQASTFTERTYTPLPFYHSCHCGSTKAVRFLYTSQGNVHQAEGQVTFMQQEIHFIRAIHPCKEVFTSQWLTNAFSYMCFYHPFPTGAHTQMAETITSGAGYDYQEQVWFNEGMHDVGFLLISDVPIFYNSFGR